MLFSWERVAETPGVELVTGVVSVPAAAAVAARVMAEVSRLASVRRPLMTPEALEFVIRPVEPLIRPLVNWSRKEVLAFVTLLAPVRILPRLMRFVTLDRSMFPAVRSTLYRAEMADPVLVPVDRALVATFLITEQEDRRERLITAAVKYFNNLITGSFGYTFVTVNV